MQSHCTTPIRVDLLHAHGSPTGHLYMKKGCRCGVCKSERAEHIRLYTAENPGKVSTYGSSYRAGHLEEIRIRKAAHYLVHREETSAIQHAFTEGLRALRESVGCQDPGPHKGPLHHHHIDPSTKLYNVSHMTSCSQESLEAEIAKCVVLCQSCHANRHQTLKTAS